MGIVAVQLYYVLAQLSVFRFMHHSPENREAYVDTQKCPKEVLSIMNRVINILGMVEVK
jgi:hypothetical protein